MKKLKFILIALALTTTVGGAVAFKAQKGNGTLFCSTTSGGDCSTVKFVSGGGSADKYCRDVTDPGTCPTSNPIRATADQ